MLSREEHPVTWAMLVYELAEAHEQLGTLIAQLQDAGGADEAVQPTEAAASTSSKVAEPAPAAER